MSLRHPVAEKGFDDKAIVAFSASPSSFRKTNINLLYTIRRNIYAVYLLYIYLLNIYAVYYVVIYEGCMRKIYVI